jgi:alpha-ketoglutarate-dependent taurine dioxygenase
MGGGYKRRPASDRTDPSIMSVNYYLNEKEPNVQNTFPLPMHGEMYYMMNRPILIWFCCSRPALSGGETTVCDGAEVWKSLRPATKTLFETQRLKYLRWYTKADWQSRFQTDDITEVEHFCHENDQSVTVDRQAQTVTTEYLYPAVITSRWGGHRVFINNIGPVTDQEQKGQTKNLVRLEDGSKIPDEVLREINQVIGDLTRGIAWKRGDFAVVDNTRVLHGRAAFQDNQREIFSRMTRSIDW